VDPVDHLVDEAGVLKNKEMGVENAGISGGWGAGKSLLKGDQLAARCKQSYLETRDFRIQFFLLKIAERNDFLFLEMDENLSLGDARCDPDALMETFGVLPGRGLSGTGVRFCWVPHVCELQKSGGRVKE
jgi:hypothetical protein